MKKGGKTRIEKGSGNIFADLGFPGAEEHLLKAQVVREIQRIVKERGLTQKAAAGLLGVSQPDLSKMFRGKFRGYSVERLVSFLTVFDRDVEIVVRKRKSGGPGHLYFRPDGISKRPVA